MSRYLPADALVVFKTKNHPRFLWKQMSHLQSPIHSHRIGSIILQSWCRKPSTDGLTLQLLTGLALNQPRMKADILLSKSKWVLSEFQEAWI